MIKQTPISGHIKTGLRNKGKKPKKSWPQPLTWNRKVPILDNCTSRSLNPSD